MTSLTVSAYTTSQVALIALMTVTPGSLMLKFTRTQSGRAILTGSINKSLHCTH